MEWLVNSVYYIVPFVVLLGVLVFVHEFGHFIVARLCGVQVEAFSIGLVKLCGAKKIKKVQSGRFQPCLWGDIANFWVMLMHLLPQRMKKLKN